MTREPHCRSLYWLGLASLLALAFWSGVGESQQGRKVLLVYDLEGVTDSVEGGDYNVRHANYPKIRESLVQDVNAAIRGLQKAGATEIVISDCHASGNDKEPDYPADRVPQGVRADIRSTPYDPYVGAVDPSFDALVMVGMHGRSGSTGFASHTYFGNTRWNLNGLQMSETSMVALSAARYRIPLILVTGDDVHKGEVAEFSNAEYVIVKKAAGPRQAEARPRDVVSREIEAAAERALRHLGQYKPFDLAPPIVSRFSFSMDDQVALAINYPGVTLIDNRTVSYLSDNYLDALLAYRTISIMLFASSANPLMAIINEMEGGPELVQQARAKLPPRRWEPSDEPIDLGTVNKLDRYGYR